MVDLLERDGYYCAYAIGKDLTAWDNAQVKLAVAELRALDWFKSSSFTPTHPKTLRINPMTAGHIPKRITSGKVDGVLNTSHHLQTGILTYATMGVCVTTPTGAEVTSVTCVAASAMTTSDYFLINCPTVANYVWFQIDAAGADPAPGGTGIEVDIVNTDTADQVATKLQTKMDLEANYGATVGTTTVTITNAASGGVDDASDYNTDFIISVTTQGTCTHAITKGTTTAPIRTAFHYEKEGTTSSPRWDLMGLIPMALDYYVSEKATVAYQVYSGMLAFTYDTADDLAQPTAHAQKALPPLTWFNYKNASGSSAFTLNAGDINLDITELHGHIGWLSYLFGAYDGVGYHIAGWVTPPFQAYLDIGARRTDAAGTDIQDIVKLTPVALKAIGDLDLIVDFYRTAGHRLKYTYDKMFIPRESYTEVFPDESTWYEGVKFKLELLDENSSLVVSETDPLSKIYYEND